MSESSLPLTAKRRHFVDDYLIHGNATRAAIAAGYSAASAGSIGSELLTMPNVRAAIAAE
jgi:phage terminase small subunit